MFLPLQDIYDDDNDPIAGIKIIMFYYEYDFEPKEFINDCYLYL